MFDFKYDNFLSNCFTYNVLLLLKPNELLHYMLCSKKTYKVCKNITFIEIYKNKWFYPKLRNVFIIDKMVFFKTITKMGQIKLLKEYECYYEKHLSIKNLILKHSIKYPKFMERILKMGATNIYKTICSASKHGILESFRILLKYGAKTDNVLGYALYGGNKDILSHKFSIKQDNLFYFLGKIGNFQLIEKYTVIFPNKNIDDLLCGAARNGNVEFINILIKENINEKLDYERAIYNAARGGHINIYNILIKRIDCEKIQKNYLHEQALRGNHFEFIDFIKINYNKNYNI